MGNISWSPDGSKFLNVGDYAGNRVIIHSSDGERDLRPWKTKLKVAGCFCKLVGARRYARIKGFCSTTRKYGKVVFDELVRVQTGDSFLRASK